MCKTYLRWFSTTQHWTAPSLTCVCINLCVCVCSAPPSTGQLLPCFIPAVVCSPPHYWTDCNVNWTRIVNKQEIKELKIENWSERLDVAFPDWIFVTALIGHWWETKYQHGVITRNLKQKVDPPFRINSCTVGRRCKAKHIYLVHGALWREYFNFSRLLVEESTFTSLDSWKDSLTFDLNYVWHVIIMYDML